MTVRWVAPPSADFSKCNDEGVSGACGPGLASNAGTQSSPWTMQKACTTAGPGDIVNIRGGLYNKENIACSVSGNASNRITFRGYVGATGAFSTREWPVFDGYIHTTLAANVSFTGACSDTDRIQLTDGTDFPDSTTLGRDSVIQIDGEFIRVNRKGAGGSTPNFIDRCDRNWSINDPLPGGAITHTAGATVVVYGNRLQNTGDFVTFRDFQLTNSYPVRAWPTIFRSRGEGIFNFADDTEFINLIIDNNLDGCFFSDGACDSLIYGTIFHSNGNIDPARGHGHAAYMHNSGGGCVGTYKQLILFNGYGFGIHAFGATVTINDMDFEEIVSFNSGVPAVYGGSPYVGTALNSPFLVADLGPSGPVNMTLKNSLMWMPAGSAVSGGLLALGTGSDFAGDGLIVQGVYAVGGSPLVNKIAFNHVTGNTNTFVNLNTDRNNAVIYQWNLEVTDVIAWNNNDIYDMRTFQDMRDSFNISSGSIPGCCKDFLGGGTLEFSSSTLWSGGSGSPSCTNGSCNSPSGTGFVQWSQGKDAATTYHGGSMPSTTISRCFANTYEPGRANCYILNWAKTSTVSLDLSGLGFNNGDSYAIWDVQNFVPWTTGSAIKTGTYSSGTPIVTGIPFSALTTVIKPIGSAMTPTHTTQQTDGRMLTVVVRKTADAGGGTAPTLSSVTPNSGLLGEVVNVTLVGTDFVIGGTTVSVSGAGVTVSAVNVSSATNLTATLTISGGAATGARNVSVTTANGTSGNVTFTVNPVPAPTLNSVTPTNGVVGTSPSVSLAGLNFVIGNTTINISGSGVTASGVNILSTTSITATFNIAGGATLGPRNVSVTTPNGTSGNVTFTVTAATPRTVLWVGA